MQHENGTSDPASGFVGYIRRSSQFRSKRTAVSAEVAARLLIAPRTQVFERAAGLEMRGPDLKEGMILPAPSEPA
jgi:hypothetical protein